MSLPVVFSPSVPAGGSQRGAHLRGAKKVIPWSKAKVQSDRAAVLEQNRAHQRVVSNETVGLQCSSSTAEKENGTFKNTSSETSIVQTPCRLRSGTAPPSWLSYGELSRSDSGHGRGRFGPTPTPGPPWITRAHVAEPEQILCSFEGERAIFDLQVLEKSIRKNSVCGGCGSGDRHFARRKDGALRDDQQGLAHKYWLECGSCGVETEWSTSTYVHSGVKRGRCNVGRDNGSSSARRVRKPRLAVQRT
jgi:hypothetical protein